MKRFCRIWIVGLCLAIVCCRGLSAAPIDRGEDFSLRETQIPISQIDLSGVLVQDPRGYPRVDWEKYRAAKPGVVVRRHAAVVIENRYLRLTLLPEMGRVYSLVSKLTGHEQLWTNAIAKPLPAHNDTGWWMIWGGVEYTIPRGEHGTTWALPWSYRIAEDSERRKAVRMSVREPETQIEQALEVSVFASRAYFEATISLRNRGEHDAKFAHWINPMWAPGGRGELTPNTELVVPCTAMLVPDRDFNRWMLGSKVQDFERNPLRFVKHWRSPGDLLAQKLTGGFYSAFSHEANEGIVRVFDPEVTPGMDIWTWGFPPPPQRQREYSETPNLGYAEMWGGTSRDYSDEARRTLRAGRTMRWKEWMYAYHGTGGLTFADEHAAILLVQDPEQRAIDLAIHVTRPIQDATLDLRLGKARLLRRKLALSPAEPFRTRLNADGAALADRRALLTVKDGLRTVARVTARQKTALLWDFPHLPR